MNVLILGSGGREHAFAWKIKQSSLLDQLYIAPGNAGTHELGENVDLNPLDFEAIGSFCLDKNIELIVVGPEAPLVEGITDFFSNHEKYGNILIVGPSAQGAKLEGSKAFAKEFMIQNKIPTARYQRFDKKNIGEAAVFLESLSAPYVLKADGLAAGKGVLILDDLNEAKEQLSAMILNNKFGEASAQVVIEEFLSGIELSVFVLTDGKDYLVLPEAKDYKRIGEGDTGLNTGGMGAISPVPFADKAFMDKVEDRIVIPTIRGLQEARIDYKGFVFIGLMNVNGDPYVIEYNVRMGDPETEVVLPRIASDLLQTLIATAEGNLANEDIKIKDEVATTVIMVSGGYPEAYEKGKIIEGLEKVNDSVVFHAGTKKSDNQILTNGGRVLAVTSYGTEMKEALQKSYTNIQNISFEKQYFRSDIGFDL
ncbi:MAG: phosphoribosylamine--glycine ligase [Flavobacteriales bacterium]|nr:phosphoribosylamine--glycine ligase [Flavobacteriales bacterium]